MSRLAVVLALLLPSPLLGQEPVLEPGARVRVTAPAVSEEPFVGTYWGLKNGQAFAITKEKTEEPVELLVSDVEGLEMSIGKRGQGWKGARIGFGVAAVGTAVPIGISCANEEHQRGECVAALVILSPLAGLVGGVIGVAIGSSIKTDIWDPVELPAKPMVAVHPTGRFSVGVSIPVRR